jgi:hypothetical protein
MGVAENIAAVRSFYAAGPADDDAARAEYASSDIVWHVPGANRVSGEYRGAPAVFETMGALMQPLDRWDIDVLEVMGNADFVMATIRLRARRYEQHVETTGGHVFRLSEGRIVEAWGFVRDQAGLDSLLDPE